MKVKNAIKEGKIQNLKGVVKQILIGATDDVFTTKELEKLTNADSIQITRSIRSLLPANKDLDRLRIGNTSYYGKKELIKKLKEGIRYA